MGVPIIRVKSSLDEKRWYSPSCGLLPGNDLFTFARSGHPRGCAGGDTSEGDQG